jgi:hypothetical protein
VPPPEAMPWVFAPVTALNSDLIAVMRSGSAMSFARRDQALEPAIARVFELNAVLGSSIGLSW